MLYEDGVSAFWRHCFRHWYSFVVFPCTYLGSTITKNIAVLSGRKYIFYVNAKMLLPWKSSLTFRRTQVVKNHNCFIRSLVTHKTTEVRQLNNGEPSPIVCQWQARSVIYNQEYNTDIIYIVCLQIMMYLFVRCTCLSIYYVKWVFRKRDKNKWQTLRQMDNNS